MAEVIDFDAYLKSRQGQRAFQKWLRWFGHPLDRALRIRDLPDEVLLALAEGAAEGNAFIDELIMGSWGASWGDVRDLNPSLRMILLDLSLSH
jgi:hypothetical protein